MVPEGPDAKPFLLTLGLEGEPDSGQHTEDIRQKGECVETSRRGAWRQQEQWRRWGGSEAVTRFCARNQCSARLSQLNNLLAIFNYWIVINSFRMQLFCGAHHTCWTDRVLANLQGAPTKIFLAEIQGEIFKEHIRLSEVIFFSTLEADSTSGINALQGGWDGDACLCWDVD